MNPAIITCIGRWENGGNASLFLNAQKNRENYQAVWPKNLPWSFTLWEYLCPVVRCFKVGNILITKWKPLMPESNLNVTELLLKWNAGDEQAQGQLMAALYDDLHRSARIYLSRERRGHTLQPTALVNEAYLRLIDQHHVEWKNRAHFLGVAAQMMRRILVDYARSRAADKRGGEAVRVTLDAALNLAEDKDIDLILLDDALQTLATLDERQSKIVELRFFGGLSVEETAEALDLSVATVMRDWRIAKMWLFRELQKGAGN